MRARAAYAVDPEIRRTFLSLAAQSFRLALQVRPDVDRRRGRLPDPTPLSHHSILVFKFAAGDRSHLAAANLPAVAGHNSRESQRAVEHSDMTT
jgi:hypothetical protein